jgi:hypothetical protein
MPAVDSGYDARVRDSYNPLSGMVATPAAPAAPARSSAQEKLALDVVSQAYIDSRGGINAQGYYNDVPASQQLTAAEQAQVRNPDGTTDTFAMAKILQQKEISSLVSQGMSLNDATSKVSSQYGQYGVSSTGAGTTSSASTSSTSKINPLTAALDSALGATMVAYGMSGIASTIAKIRADYPEATSEQLLTLLKTDSRYNTEYNTRFAGNTQLRSKGLPTIDDATYLKAEVEYGKVLQSYGLNNLANKSMYATFISNSMDLQDVTERVGLAYDRLKATPQIEDAFKAFYPSLTQTDIVSAMLDPTNQLPALKNKVTAAEIGGAALAQHLTTNLTDYVLPQTAAYTNVSGGTVGAETLRAAGITGETAAIGYKTIAEQLPTMEKLSSIYGGALDQYGQKQAEEEQLLGLASAKRAKQALVAVETAQFQGASGVGPAGLSTMGLKKSSSAGQF